MQAKRQLSTRGPVEDQDAVASAHCSESMGDDLERAPSNDVIDPRLDQGLILWVQARGGLVDYHQGRISEECPGRGHALDASGVCALSQRETDVAVNTLARRGQSGP